MARGGHGTSTIVVHGNGGGVSMRYVLYLAVPGAGVYVYMKMKGYGLADIQWVSATRFKEAVIALGKAQDVLDTKIVAFRASAEQTLTAFRTLAERKFGLIEEGVQSTRGELSATRRELAGVDSRVQRLEVCVQLSVPGFFRGDCKLRILNLFTSTGEDRRSRCASCRSRGASCGCKQPACVLESGHESLVYCRCRKVRAT